MKLNELICLALRVKCCYQFHRNSVETTTVRTTTICSVVRYALHISLDTRRRRLKIVRTKVLCVIDLLSFAINYQRSFIPFPYLTSIWTRDGESEREWTFHSSHHHPLHHFLHLQFIALATDSVPLDTLETVGEHARSRLRKCDNVWRAKARKFVCVFSSFVVRSTICYRIYIVTCVKWRRLLPSIAFRFNVVRHTSHVFTWANIHSVHFFLCTRTWYTRIACTVCAVSWCFVSRHMATSFDIHLYYAFQNRHTKQKKNFSKAMA